MRTFASAAACGTLALPFVILFACGSKPPPKSPDDLPTVSPDGGTSPEAGGEGGTPSVCSGSSLDLNNVLVQSACEVPNAGADSKQRDMSALLTVKVSLNPATVSPGGHADVVVTFTNKSSSPLPLDFRLDPTARFSVEAYTSTNRRAELPKTPQPHGKNDNAGGEPSAPGTAEVTIAAGGTASAKLGWDAVKMRWAPELLKGTPPEQGYPTAPAGPLPKGKYLLKVITPLVGVFEGSDHEVSTAKTTVVVQ
jgi:hypothetical protein